MMRSEYIPFYCGFYTNKKYSLQSPQPQCANETCLNNSVAIIALPSCIDRINFTVVLIPSHSFRINPNLVRISPNLIRTSLVLTRTSFS